jgi:hypothetical protein
MYNHFSAIRRKFRFILIIILIPALLPAQQLPGGYDVISNLQQQLWMNKTLVTSVTGYKNVKGTPMLFEEFHTGNFYFNNKTCLKGKLINYNCFTDEVLFSDEKNTYTTNSQDIGYFTINGNKEDTILLFKQVFLLSEKKRIFMQVLYQQESVLFKRYCKKFLEADYDKPYGQNRQFDEYNDYYEYYIMPDGQEPVILRQRKSSIAEIFNDKSDLMEDYFKKEKINLKNEGDLIRLVEHYDNLNIN